MPNVHYNDVITGDVLRQLRQEHGWTQKELAKLACCNVSTISSVERGLHPLSDAIFLTLCRTLNCLPSDLLKNH